MARGSLAKQEITQKLLSTFSGSFLYNNDKEIRIPWMENGETLQIKLSLVCAKTNVEPEGEINFDNTEVAETAQAAMPSPVTEPTAEEKRNVEVLLRKLDLI